MSVISEIIYQIAMTFGDIMHTWGMTINNNDMTWIQKPIWNLGEFCV